MKNYSTFFLLSCICCIFLFNAGYLSSDLPVALPDEVNEGDLVISHSLDDSLVVVTIMPLQAFVDYICIDTVQTHLLLPPGSDPHSYEPSPRDLMQIEEADVLVMIGAGMPFEMSIVSQIRDTNQDIVIINTSQAVSLLQEEGGHGVDPHIWLSPITAQEIVDLIAEELSAVSPSHSALYHERATAFRKEMQDLDAEFSEMLSHNNTTMFLVSHPSWGYVADAYGLTQLAIYDHGKDPSPKTLQTLIDTAQKDSLSVIIADPLENQNAAHIIADAISGEAIVISPLAYDYTLNMRRFLYAITKEGEIDG